MQVLGSSDPASGEFAARVIQVIAHHDEKLDETRITLQTTLESLGLDSFGTISLMFDLEQEFHVEISDEMLSGIRTVGDIIKGLHRLCGPVQAGR